MKAWSLFFATGLLLAASAVSALSLSPASLHSKLGDPMAATVTISNGTPLNVAEVKVQLGSTEDFAAAGFDKAELPDDLKISLTQDGAQLKISLSTRLAITSPYLGIVLVVETSEARILQPYTLLMDLPK